MKIGVVCPSEIAIRRFMPALSKFSEIEFAGIGINSVEERYGNDTPSLAEVNEMLETENRKADVFIDAYGGKKFGSYEELISAPNIDAVYIPLPPALHYKWAKMALLNGKHVMVEKPATTALNDTMELVRIAKEKNLALHENYMFIFHSQLDAIETIINEGVLGDIRLYRISFGFPQRGQSDFRYNKALGGGALIDAGGYTIKYARRLLGDTAHITEAQLNYINEFEVDIYGSATMKNDKGNVAQIAFGMDNDYKCELEIWGSKGTLTTGRVLTAPVGFVPSARIKRNNDIEEILLPEDDSFKKSIDFFIHTIREPKDREKSYKDIATQAQMIEDYYECAGKNRQKGYCDN